MVNVDCINTLHRSYQSFPSVYGKDLAYRKKTVCGPHSRLWCNTDKILVQWWTSFIFAIFGGAILIGSRKYLAPYLTCFEWGLIPGTFSHLRLDCGPHVQ